MDTSYNSRNTNDDTSYCSPDMDYYNGTYQKIYESWLTSQYIKAILNVVEGDTSAS